MSLTIPSGRFGAYIFDCDGTLVDSMPLHLEAWNYGLEKAGAKWKLAEDFFYGSAGKSLSQVVDELNAMYSAQLEADEVGHHKEAFYHEKIESLEAFQDVVEHLEIARASGIPTAVASGSARLAVEKSLEVTNLIGLVDTIVAAEDVFRGKPAPDCFLLAADRLGVEPEGCLVFEDGEAGLEAARVCGMATVEVDARRGAKV